MGWEIAIALGIMSTSFLLFYLMGVIDAEGKGHFPLKVFFFMMGLLVLYGGVSYGVMVVKTEYDVGVGGLDEANFNAITNVLVTVMDVMRWVLYISFAWIMLYLLFGTISILKDFMAEKKKRWAD